MNDRRPPPERGVETWRLRREHGFRLIQRCDPVLGLIAACVIAALVVLALVFGGLRAVDHAARPVPDTRILGSFTAQGPCFVETATDTDGTVWTSLKRSPECESNVASGGVAPYDPVWRLWGGEAQPFRNDHGGIDPGSLARLEGELWVKGDSGGIAVAPSSEDWRVWLSQSEADGDNGLLEQADVAAVTGLLDAPAFLLATHSGRLVRYLSETGSWDTIGRLEGTGRIGGIFATKRHLWVWRDHTLLRYGLSAGGAAINLQGKVPIHGIEHIVRSGSDLVVHSRIACRQGDGLCDRLDVLDDTSLTPRSLLDATDAPRSWTPEDILYVAQLGDKLVLAGPKGASAYDTSRRIWKSVDFRPVRTFIARSDSVAIGGQGFAKLLSVQEDLTIIVAGLPHEDSSVTGLFFAPDGALNIATELGSLWSMSEDGDLASRFKVSAPREAAAVGAVLSDETVDLFVTEQNTVVLNRSDRTYRSMPTTAPLGALLRSQLRHFEGNPILAAAAPDRGKSAQVVALNLAQPEQAASVDIPGDQSVAALTLLPDAKTALLSTSQDRLYGLDTSRKPMGLVDMMEGQPASGLSEQDITGISDLNGDLVLGGAKGVSVYSFQQRSWRLLTQSAVTSVAADAASQFIYSTTPTGVVQRHALRSNGVQQLAGMAQFPFADDTRLADALISPDDDVVLLAGDGRGGIHLQLYDSHTRTSRALARFPKDGPLDAEILSFSSPDAWLVRIGDRAYVEGPRVLGLAPRSAGVETGWREPSGAVVTLERDRQTGLKFLHRMDLASDTSRCLYRGAAVEVDRDTELRALPNGNILASGGAKVQFYDQPRHRWVPLSGTGDDQGKSYAAAFGKIWSAKVGQTGPSGAPLLWYLPGTIQDPAAESCAPNAPARSFEPLEMAAVDLKGEAVLHMRPDGAVVRTDMQNGQNEVLLRPPELPSGFQGPLRILATDHVLWLAFSNGVLAYDLGARAWTVMGRVDGQDWDQVTLERGRGRLDGRVVAAYSRATQTQSLEMMISGLEPERTQEKRYSLRAPDPVSFGDEARHVTDAWAEDGALVLRFGESVRVLNADTGTWETAAFGAINDAFRIGVLGDRLVAWDGVRRQFYYQGGRTRRLAYSAPFASDPLPAGVTPFVQSSGTPGYFTPEGALHLCDQTGRCRESVPASDAFERALIHRAFATGQGFVLVNNAGQATYLDLQTMQLRRLFERDAPAGQELQTWMTEPVSKLWPAKQGDGVMVQSTKGDFARLSGRRPMRIEPERVLRGRDVIAFNADEGIALAADGSLAWAGASASLPSSVEAAAVRAIGVHKGRVWWLEETGLYSLPEACLEGARGAVVVQGATSCDPLKGPVPRGGSIAYLQGDWEGETPLSAQMKSGKRLELGRDFLRRPFWKDRGESLLHEVDVARDIAPLLHVRPDGVETLQPTIRVTTEAGLVTEIHPPRAQALRVVSPETLRMPALDLAWLRFDRDRQRFMLGAGDGASVISGESAFDAAGRFRPFAVQRAHFQGDGSVLLTLPSAMRVVGAKQSAFSSASAGSYKQVAGRDARGLLPDDGGAWLGRRFIEAPHGRMRALVSPDLPGVLSARGDRRHPGVVLRHGQSNAVWITAEGFAWDRFSQLGWHNDGTAVIETALGALPVTSPLETRDMGSFFWSDDTFRRLQNMDAFVRPDPSRSLADPQRLGVQALAGDDISDAAMLGGQGLLATGYGLRVSPAFGYDGHFLRPGEARDSIELHRLTGLAVVDGGEFVVRDGQLSRPTQTQKEALRSADRGQLGPLVIRSEEGRFRLWLADSNDRTLRVPALIAQGARQSRFAVDDVFAITAGEDRSVLQATQAGHVIAPGGVFDLAEAKLSVNGSARLTPDVVETPAGRFAVARTPDGAVAQCKLLRAGRISGRCSARIERSSVISQSSLGTLTAVLEPAGARFRLAPQGGATPELATRLHQGRFDHDRITHVAACHGAIHYFTRAGLHLRQDDSAVDWRQGVAIARRALPTGLQCPEAFPKQGLSDMLIAYGEGEMVEGNFMGETPHEIFLRAQTADRYLRGPAVPTRPLPQSRILHNDAAGNLLEITPELKLHSELMIGGETYSPGFVDGVGPAMHIDIPRGFVQVAQNMWAITHDAFVPMQEADEALSLSRSGPPVQNLPVVCRGAALRTIWIAPDLTDLWCGSTRYQLSATEDGRLQLNRMTQGRRRIAASGSLVLRVEDTAGLEDLTLGGELNRASRFDGGFAFDHVLGIAAARDQGLAIVTDLGWHLYRQASLSLDVQMQAGLDPETTSLRRKLPRLRRATGIEGTHNPWVTCISIGERTVFVRADAGGLQQEPWTQKTCVKFLGSDGMREAWSPEADTESLSSFELGGQRCYSGDHQQSRARREIGQVPVFTFRLPSGLVCDQIESGRFQADTATSLPILRPVSPERARMTPFCARTKNQRIAILGPVEFARERVQSDSCIEVRRPARAEADMSAFSVRNGGLFRQRLR